MNYVYGIYDLAEPNKCYYVGVTISPKVRMQLHRSQKTPTRRWLKKADRPVMKILGGRMNRKAALRLEHNCIQDLNPALNVHRNGLGESPPHLRIPDDLYAMFKEIQKNSPARLTIPAIVHHAIRSGGGVGRERGA